MKSAISEVPGRRTVHNVAFLNSQRVATRQEAKAGVTKHTQSRRSHRVNRVVRLRQAAGRTNGDEYSAESYQATRKGLPAARPRRECL